VDPLTAVIKARDLMQRVNTRSIPVPLEPYLKELRCELKVKQNLGPKESGYSFPSPSGDKHFIVVNGKESPERQRFTAFHEMAHIELGLPSEHTDGPSLSFARRSPNEMCCDIFAAELLLPYWSFKQLVNQAEIGFDAIEQFAEQYEASVTATGSRFAAANEAPCAFVLSHAGKVKYAERSKSLREAQAWISPGSVLPSGSSSARCRGGEVMRDVNEIPADIWFTDWSRGGQLLEEVRHLSAYDQTLTLLWFEDEEVPCNAKADYEEDEDEDYELLRPLDGKLPFPGKRRRR
jgi:Zn-dependent peptidase ImmA (M78 family)